MEQKKSASLADRWLVRLMLAAILAFGSEILLWSNPTGRDVSEWLLILPTYLAISALLLDIMRRYNIRDLFGLMILSGVYGLLNTLLINPESVLFDFPRSLIVRGIGAHALLGLEMFFVFLALTGGHLRHLKRVLLIGAAIVGFAWGTWGRWSADFAEVPYSTISLETLLITGLIGLAIVLFITFFVYRNVRAIYPDDMLLSIREWAIIMPFLMLVLFIRIAQLSVDSTSLTLCLIILVLCMMIFWFRRNTTYKIILVYHLPIFPLDRITMALSIAIWLWMATLFYSLPLIGTPDLNQFTVIMIGFTLYSAGWLPAVSFFIGIRTYIRQVQGQPL